MADGVVVVGCDSSSSADLLTSALQNKGIRPSLADEIFSECEIISLHLPLSALNITSLEIAQLTK
jgi:hypothetical protein